VSTAHPPRLAAALLARCVPPGPIGDAILGDLYEAYLARAFPPDRRDGPPQVVATLWYWGQVPRIGGRYLFRRTLFRGLYRRLTAPSAQAAYSPPRGSMMHDIARDTRLTLRSFRRNPGFAAATMLVLGIGIGAVSLMFSTYNTVVLQPLPFPDPDRLVWIWSTLPGTSDIPGANRNSTSYDDYVDYRQSTDAFQSLGSVMVFNGRWLLTGKDQARQVTGFIVSANLFATLGVPPALGRSFIAADELRGQQDVVILSHGLWTNWFGADPTVVGQTVNMNGGPVEIVGVMPAGFDFPAGADAWFPLQRSAGYASGRGNNNFFAIGRLRDGETMQQAQAQMDVVAANIAATYPDTKAGWGVELQSLHDRFFGPAGASILLLMGIIALVPLVACANVASLFMARALTRRSEFASRLALGAARPRLVRQLVTESLVMALGGGAVGLALAYGGGEALRRFAPAALPRLDAIGIDGNVMAFTLLAALLTVPLFGVIPALRSTDVDIAEALKVGGRGGSGGRQRGRSGLVVAQVALSLVLMLASGLLLRGYLGLQAQDLGFRTSNLLYSQVSLPSFKYDGNEAGVDAAWKDLLTRMKSAPGVTAVGAIDRQPLGGLGPTNSVWASQRPPASAAEKITVTRRWVSDGLFDAMGIPVIAGRAFSSEDEQAGQQVIIVNEALARRFFPDENPVGQTLVLDWDVPRDMTVVGVVGDVLEQGPGQDAFPIFYLPLWWSSPTSMWVLARTLGTAPDFADRFRETVRAVDPDIPEAPMRSMEDRLSSTLFQPRFRSTLVAVFALVSLILSAIGLYGVLAYFVRQQAHELGVRLALGATGEGVATLVMKKGLSLVALGLIMGLAGGVVGARALVDRGWLPGVSPYDPVTYGGVAACLAIVGFAACAAPALRALRIDPAEVMRAE
jgi:putative ABC transport system permease protein